jgi:hypothetical protein
VRLRTAFLNVLQGLLEHLLALLGECHGRKFRHEGLGNDDYLVAFDLYPQVVTLLDSECLSHFEGQGNLRFGLHPDYRYVKLPPSTANWVVQLDRNPVLLYFNHTCLSMPHVGPSY